jgi:hypothetical protein
VTVVRLSKPIEAHGNTLSELKLREPTGRDLRTCGVPYRLGADESMQIEASVMHRMIAQLAQVPPSAVDQLSASDWQEAATVVLGFFGPATGSSAPTTS